MASKSGLSVRLTMKQNSDFLRARQRYYFRSIGPSHSDW